MSSLNIEFWVRLSLVRLAEAYADVTWLSVKQLRSSYEDMLVRHLPYLEP